MREINYGKLNFKIDFCAIQILREINFREPSSSTVIFSLVKTLNFVYMVHFNLQKVQKFRASKCVKMVDIALLESQKLISRKIWLIGKSPHFHSVL